MKKANKTVLHNTENWYLHCFEDEKLNACISITCALPQYFFIIHYDFTYFSAFDYVSQIKIN